MKVTKKNNRTTIVRRRISSGVKILWKNIKREKCVLRVPSGQIWSAWDWYHWIGLEKEINRYRFWIFFISVLKIWKDFKVLSSFIQNWIQSPACSDHGLYRILSSYWMAHFIWWKNLPKNWLFWFGLRDVGILHSRAVIQRTIVDFPAFLEHGLAEEIAVCVVPIQTVIQTNRKLNTFLYEAAQNFSNIQKLEKINKKTYRGWWFI